MMRVAFMIKKRQLTCTLVKEKQSFKTHCALSNSNPANNSYIVVGVEDQDNEIVGVDF
jgi:predicted HTH transcriptional regulator